MALRIRPASVAFVLLPLAILCACGKSDTTHIPGVGKVTVDDPDSDDPAVRIEGADGTSIEVKGSRSTIRGAGGEIRQDTAAGLDKLGIELPPGVALRDGDNGIMTIDTPEGSQVLAVLVTELGPDEITEFYASKLTLSMRTMIGDTATMSAELEDGSSVTITLGEPEDGKRELMIMVLREKKK